MTRTAAEMLLSGLLREIDAAALELTADQLRANAVDIDLIATAALELKRRKDTLND